MNPESEFPCLYHAHHNRQLEDLPFWLRLAERFGEPILELGCGTGRIFIPLSEAGYRLTGLDNDSAMLAFLQGSSDTKKKPSLIRADMTQFHLAQAFRLVILPCNTYSTLTASQRHQSLGCIRRCLVPGGAFATSLPNPLALKRLPKKSRAEIEEVFPHPRDGEPVQVSSAWERITETFLLEWHYDHLLSDGQVKRTTAQVRHSLEDIDRYLEEFDQAGFDKVEVFGDFDETPYHEDAPNLIFVAQS